MIVKAFQPLVFRRDIKDVTSPPFDVITKDQEAALKESRYNITHLTLPELGIPGKSRELLMEWHRQGIIAKESEPCLIVITQDFRGNGKDYSRIGLIAPVETSPPAGIILPHEDTFDWAVKDRRNLMEATGCQLDNLNTTRTPLWCFLISEFSFFPVTSLSSTGPELSSFSLKDFSSL